MDGGTFERGPVSWFGSSGWPPETDRATGRIDYGPGYLFKKQVRTVIVLLAGGDKRTQSRDIETALRLSRNL